MAGAQDLLTINEARLDENLIRCFDVFKKVDGTASTARQKNEKESRTHEIFRLSK